MDVKEVRKIQLPKGGELEVEMTDAFLNVVRKHFNMSNLDHVDDDHIRMFIWGAVNNAVLKEITNES